MPRLRAPARRASAAAALLILLGACSGVRQARTQQADAHYRMATAYLQQTGDIRSELNRRAAYPELKTAIALDGKNPEYRRLLGAIHLADRDFAAAEREIREALRLSPSFPEARNDLGSIYAHQGRYQEAVREFRVAVENRSYATPQLARYNLAKASFQLGDYTEAADAYERYLETEPGDADARHNLGMCYVRLGRLADAERAFAKVVETRTDALLTRYELGMVLFKLARRPEAVAQFQAVSRLDPAGELGEQARTYLKILR